MSPLVALPYALPQKERGGVDGGHTPSDKYLILFVCPGGEGRHDTYSILFGQVKADCTAKHVYSMVGGVRSRGLCAPSTLYVTATQ